jgi:hypothetical protein
LPFAKQAKRWGLLTASIDHRVLAAITLEVKRLIGQVIVAH